jgi:sialidase-1
MRQSLRHVPAAFRIPGLVTTNKGTLLGVYDVRYNSSVDLQEYVDVGLSRSTDGGKTWEKMRLPLSFGNSGRMTHGFGKPGKLFVVNAVFFIFIVFHDPKFKQ